MPSKLLLAKKTFSNMLLPKQVFERREEGFVVTEKKFCIKLDFYVVRRILLSTYCTLSTLSSTAMIVDAWYSTTAYIRALSFLVHLDVSWKTMQHHS
jgi:hypothetical protein